MYVEEQHHSVDNCENYHPEMIVWEPETWGGIADKLLDFLEMAFHTYPTTIDEAALAMYFSTLLMDDATKRYIQAAKQGLLRVYDPMRRSKRMEPGDIEPTCISGQPEAYQDALWEMKEIIDENWLEMIGQKIVDMGNEKLVLLAAEMME